MLTTTNVVPTARRVRSTARARETKPDSIVWKRMKKSAMSVRNWAPSTRSATARNGFDARLNTFER